MSIDALTFSDASQVDLASAFAKLSFDHLLRCGVFSGPDVTGTSSPYTNTRLRTAFDLFSNYRGVQMGLPEVDASFQGGVPPGFVVELCGPPAVGKSRLAALIAAHHATLEANRHLEHVAHDEGAYFASDFTNNHLATVAPPAMATSVVYLQCDHHCRHVVSTIADAVHYHSTLRWERAATSSGLMDDGGGASAKAIEALALQSIAVCDVIGALDSSPPALVAEDPLRAVIQILQSLLCTSEVSLATRVVVIDSVPSLLKRAFSGHPSEAAARHDALALFLQRIKDIAVLFNVVVVLTNHVVMDNSSPSGGLTDGDGEGAYRHLCDRFETSLRGALGTPFYHAVNIRILLFCPSEEASNGPPSKDGAAASSVIYLHVAKSPIGPTNTFVLAGLLSPLSCYGEGATAGSLRLKPSVHITTILQ